MWIANVFLILLSFFAPDLFAEFINGGAKLWYCDGVCSQPHPDWLGGID